MISTPQPAPAHLWGTDTSQDSSLALSLPQGGEQQHNKTNNPGSATSFDEDIDSTRTEYMDSYVTDEDTTINAVLESEDSPAIVMCRTKRKHLSRALDANLFEDSIESESSDEDLPTFL